MNYIVLIKQVPDIRNIPPDAWDWEKGTLRRGMLDTVCNELDRQALAFTAALRRERDGKVVVLTMGPPFATEVLRFALSICADRAVLLTDRKLGGADTPATAYPLSQSIRKIEKEMFGGDRDYLIITGMQSVDGDTAQVPPQVAEELGIPHIAYATSYRYEGGELQVARITRNGKEVLAPSRYPALITVTSWTEPPFASFGRTAWAFDQEIVTWSAADVEADPARIGLTGSRTTVNRIFSPKDVSTKNCEYVTDMRRLAEQIKRLYAARLSSHAATEDVGEQYRLPEDGTPTFRGEVWVYAEHDEGGLHPSAFELLGRASALARSLGEKVAAVLPGSGVEGLAADLIAHGADKVYLAEHPMLGHFSAMPYTEAIGELIGLHRPQIVLFAATPLGRELAPRVAYRTNSGLTADCTALDLIDLKRAGKEYTGILRQTRPALGGNIMASIITQNAQIQMSTARPGVLKALPRDDSRRGEVIKHTPELSEERAGVRLVSFEPVQATAQLTDAGVIVTGGGGLRTKENYDAYIRPLAAELGRALGVESMVGASGLRWSVA